MKSIEEIVSGKINTDLINQQINASSSNISNEKDRKEYLEFMRDLDLESLVKIIKSTFLHTYTHEEIRFMDLIDQHPIQQSIISKTLHIVSETNRLTQDFIKQSILDKDKKKQETPTDDSATVSCGIPLNKV